MSNKRSYAVWPAFFWLIASLMGISINNISAQPIVGLGLFFYSWWTLGFSLLAMGMFFVDKRAAVRERRRISEKTLFTTAAIGGWPGAVIGQQWFRHKSSKMSFRIRLWFIVLAHIGIAAALLWFRN